MIEFLNNFNQTYKKDFVWPCGTLIARGIHVPLYMKAGCGVTPPPTGIPPTKDGGVPCMSGALLPKETTIKSFFFKCHKHG